VFGAAPGLVDASFRRPLAFMRFAGDRQVDGDASVALAALMLVVPAGIEPATFRV
jgi:hypothetical protein